MVHRAGATGPVYARFVDALLDFLKGGATLLIAGAFMAMAGLEGGRVLLMPFHLFEQLGPDNSWVRRPDGRVIGEGPRGRASEIRMRIGLFAVWLVAALIVGTWMPY